MLTTSTATRVFLAAGDTDMRKSFDTLSAIVRGELGGDPVSGNLYVFCNKRRNRIKVLHFDGSGLWVSAKRLERGTFYWPKDASEKRIELAHEELAALLGGLDLRPARRRRWYRKTNEESRTHVL